MSIVSTSSPLAFDRRAGGEATESAKAEAASAPLPRAAATTSPAYRPRSLANCGCQRAGWAVSSSQFSGQSRSQRQKRSRRARACGGSERPHASSSAYCKAPRRWSHERVDEEAVTRVKQRRHRRRISANLGESRRISASQRRQQARARNADRLEIGAGRLRLEDASWMRRGRVVTWVRRAGAECYDRRQVVCRLRGLQAARRRCEDERDEALARLGGGRELAEGESDGGQAAHPHPPGPTLREVTGRGGRLPGGTAAEPGLDAVGGGERRTDKSRSEQGDGAVGRREHQMHEGE